LCQNQLLAARLNATLLLELNGLRRYFATNSPVPDTLDDIASQILRVLEATATVDEQALGIDFTTWNQRGLIAQEISYYRFVHLCDRNNGSLIQMGFLNISVLEISVMCHPLKKG